MRLVIVGYYGFRNLGDEVILSSMLRELRSATGGVECIVTSGNPALTSEQHGVRAVHWRDIPAIVDAVAGSDAVILGGGGLFHDLWGFPGETVLTPDHWGIPYFAGPAVLSSLHGKPLVLYGVGVESIADAGAREMTRAVFELSWAATVRDEVSASFLRELGVPPDRFEVTADPAWLFGVTPDASMEETLSERGEGDPFRIGVALRSWGEGAEAGWLDEVASALEKFAISLGARVSMVPFQVLSGEEGYDDRLVARAIEERFTRRDLIEIAAAPHDAAEAVESFRRCHVTLGMRYHSILLAALAGSPVVGLAYAPKVRGLMRQLHMEDRCFEVDSVGREPLGEALQRAWESRRELRRKLVDRIAVLRELARHNTNVIEAAVTGRLRPPVKTPATASLVERSLTRSVTLAASRTQEVLELVSQRDSLLEERDALQEKLTDLERAHRTLEQTHRDLEEGHARLEEEHAVLLAGHEALEEAYEELRETHEKIVTSRLYAVLSGVWKFRNGLQSLVRRLVGGGSGEEDDGPIRWKSYLFDRFKERMEEVFGGVHRRVVSRDAIGRVSVIVLVEGSCHGLRATLKSLGSQETVSFEVVVAIPGGRPELVEEARRIVAQAEVGAEVFPVPGEGRAALLWEGVARCSGDGILWVDAGELLHPTALARMVRTLEESARCQGVCAPRPARSLGRRGDGPESVDLCTFNVAPSGVEPPWVLLVRREALELIGRPGNLTGKLGLTDLVMRLNEAVTLGVIGGDPPILLPSGLVGGAPSGEATASAGAAQLAVFDDFRRNRLQSAVLWRLPDAANGGGAGLGRRLEELAVELGDVVQRGDGAGRKDEEPLSWLPAVDVRLDGVGQGMDGGDGPSGFLVSEGHSQEDPGGGWDLVVDVRLAGPPRDHTHRGTWHVAEEADLVRLIRLLAIFRYFHRFEGEVARWEEGRPPLKASVVVCTHRPIPPLEAALESLARQEMDPAGFEVIVVNNAPSDPGLREELERIETRSFRKSDVKLRTVACPVPGLAHARNAGIAAARGELLLFLDDDAVAPPDWVATAVGLFAENPEYGVIGGYIRLATPEPRPDVVQPGWERYWSQYLGGREHLYEVKDWWDYPWGASWCARRSVLLRIGGFRVGYGRTREDFAGGEEVVAASLASRLGWKIGVAPELEVEHRVIRERFTWRHVKRTVLAGTMGNYRMQRDLYIPMDGIGWTLRCLLSPGVDKTVGADTVLARLRHWSYRKRAWARLLAWQFRDVLELRRLKAGKGGCSIESV